MVCRGGLCACLESEGRSLARPGICDDGCAVLSRENHCRCVVTLGYRKRIEPLCALIRHVVNNDRTRRLALCGNLVEALCQLPPDIKGKTLGWIDEFELRRQRIGVGRVLVIVEGVVDQIVFAEGRRRMWPGRDDNNFPLNIFGWIVVVVEDQVGSDAFSWR